MVEFAIVLPVLALLLLAILQFAVLFSVQIGLTNAARETSRSASAIPIADATTAGTAATTFYNRLRNTTNGALKRNLAPYDAGALVESGSTADLSVRRTRVCYYSITDVSGAPAIMTLVEVEYRHPIFIPLISAVLGTGIQLGVREDIRVSNVNLTSAGGIGTLAAPTCNA